MSFARKRGSYYPRSFLKLILIGFALVSAPLVVAFVYTAFYVDRLAGQARSAVDQAAQAARESRLLMEHVTSMERLARQYAILGDPQLVASYETLRGQFRQTTGSLAALPLDARQRDELKRVADDEDVLYGRLAAQPRQAADRASLVDGYVGLSRRARQVLEDSNELIDREIDRMRETAAAAQRTLLVQFFATLPLGGAIAILIAVLMTRPIRKLDAAIRQLGRADLDRPIQVVGPEDLSRLGDRLEWLRQRLSEVERQKASFLRHVSHELKTPLTSLREGAELLADGSAGALTAPQREIVGILRRASDDLAAMIGDLLDYQRAMSDLANLELTPIDLEAVARRVIDAHRLAAGTRGVSFELSAQPVEVVADPDKVRVILDNLVSNAVKFSPEGGKVSVSIAVEGRQARLDVVDDGPGVPPEERERIFDLFFRGRPAAGGRVQGSGLGLGIARELAQAHGGRIEVTDDEGGGAHFRVELPLVGPAAAEAGR